MLLYLGYMCEVLYILYLDGTGYTAVSQPAHCAGKPTHTKQHRLYTVTIHVVIWFLYHKCYYLLSHVTIFYKIILKISTVKIWNIVVSKSLQITLITKTTQCVILTFLCISKNPELLNKELQYRELLLLK